jgi:glycosyltransferase involved in cell wall biosynthesis
MDSLPSYLRPIDQVLSPTQSVASPGVPIPATPAAAPTSSDNLTTPSFSFQTAPLTSYTAPPETKAPSNSKKLRFLLVGTHAHQFTGYSKVTYGIVTQLAALPWMEVTHFGFQKHPQIPPEYRPYPSNVDVMDAAKMEQAQQGQQPQGQPPQQLQGFGYSVLIDVLRKKKPNVVMIYNDMSIVTRFLEEIRKSGIPRDFKIWIYCDQVYDRQLQGMIDLLNRDADRVFAFTDYWKKRLRDQGVTRPLSVLGHGFNPKMFFPIPREMARKSLKMPEDAFVIMNLNRNQPRKRLDLLIMAFVELVVKYPTKPIILLSISDKGEKGGWWLFEVFVDELKARGVPIEQFGNRLMISNQDMAFKDEDINILYNIADVGISTAEGEGWGLCNFEQMGVGIPQVIPDIGGFKDFCNSENSILVKPKYKYYLPSVYSPVGGLASVCDPHDICLALEEYVNDSDKKKRHGIKAKETVLTYTWEKATKELITRLDEEFKEL